MVRCSGDDYLVCGSSIILFRSSRNDGGHSLFSFCVFLAALYLSFSSFLGAASLLLFSFVEDGKAKKNNFRD